MADIEGETSKKSYGDDYIYGYCEFNHSSQVDSDGDIRLSSIVVGLGEATAGTSGAVHWATEDLVLTIWYGDNRKTFTKSGYGGAGKKNGYWSDVSGVEETYDTDFDSTYLHIGKSGGTVSWSLDCTFTYYANSEIITGPSDRSAGGTFYVKGITSYTCRASSEDIKKGTVSPTGDQTVYEGDSITFTATENLGYEFEYWLDSYSAKYTDNPLTLYPKRDTNYTAYFKELLKEISFYKAGLGSGSVSMAVPGQEVVTEENISKPVLAGYTVAFNATADEGSKFTGWYKDDILLSSSTTYNYTVLKNDDEELKIAAYFSRRTPRSFKLRWEKETGVHLGTVSLNNTTVTLPYTHTYYDGDEIMLQYFPNYTTFTGWVFHEEEGTFSTDNNPYTFTISEDVEIGVDFTWYQANKIRARSNNFNGGYAYITFDGQTSKQTATENAEMYWTDPDKELDVYVYVPQDTPTQRFAYEFSEWTVYNQTRETTTTSTDNPYKFNRVELFNGNYILTADVQRRFYFECYAVPQTEGSAYMIVGEEHYTLKYFYYGDTVTIHAEDSVEGYTFSYWSVESLDPTYLDVTQRDLTFTVNEHTANAIGSHAFYIAKFVQTGTVTILSFASPSKAGTIYINGVKQGSITVNEGTSVTLKIEVNDGYQFTKWNNGSTDTEITITANSNATYIAYCEEKQDTNYNNIIPLMLLLMLKKQKKQIIQTNQNVVVKRNKK